MMLILDPLAGSISGICRGPDADGRCPQAESGTVPCIGHRVVPLRGTPGAGLPFTVTGCDADRCPLRWTADPAPPGVSLRFAPVVGNPEDPA